MKKLIPIVLIALSPLCLPADEMLMIDAEAQKIVETELLAPLRSQQAPEQMFSRRRLMPVRCEWGLPLTEGLRTFTIFTSHNAIILGLYEAEGSNLYLLDPEKKTYVPVNEHPLWIAMENT